MKLIESIDETKKQKKTKKIKSRLASWELFFLGEIILKRVVAVVVVVGQPLEGRIYNHHHHHHFHGDV